MLLSAPPQTHSVFAPHFALRNRREKTVMPLRNTHVEDHWEAELVAMPEERQALDYLFSVTYEELRRLASSVSRGDPSATLNPTALVNEAWAKLANSPHLVLTSRLHFKRIAARAMRQVLIEAARRRNADKRGNGAAVIEFDEAQQSLASCGQDLLALNAALESLARIHLRQAMMVESRFFGGLGVAEIADLFNVSEATVLRDWRAAKAWLAQELKRPR